MKQERRKIEQIWDFLLELADDDDDMTGTIGHGWSDLGRLTANFDGVRYSIYIDLAEEP